MTPLGLVLVLLAQAPTTPLPAEGEPVRYRADHGASDGHGEVLHLQGKAELRTDTARILADGIDYDQRTRIVTATGNCYAVSGLAGAVADGLTLDLDGNWLQLQNGRFFVKADVTPEVLLQTSTPEQLMATGRTTLAARVERVERAGQGHLKINGLDFTPCDCNPLEAHWSIKATAADVHPGDQAWLWLPVIYVYGVPILPLPLLNVPLKPQKTGLLVTTPAHSAQNGWQVTQPVYFALASNWDLTLSPGYTWGSTTPPAVNAALLGVKGPSVDTEVRWAHSRDTKGNLELFLLDDRLNLRDPRFLTYYAASVIEPTKVTGELRNLRGSLNGAVLQSFGGGWRARVDVNLVSDAALVKDTTTDITQQANQYLRSSAVVDRRSSDSLLSIEVTARQDIAWGGFSAFENDAWPRALYDPTHAGNELDPHQDNSGNTNTRGQWLRGPATLQKLPTVRLDLPSRPLGEHLSWALSADFTRLAPFSGHGGDEGVDGIYQLGGLGQPQPTLVNPMTGQPNAVCPENVRSDLLTQGDRVWQCGEREARLRLDLVPKLSGSWGIGDWLRIQPSIWIRQDLYFGEVTRTTEQRGYVVGDILVSSEISRTFSNGLRHAIQPSLQYREIPGQWGSVPGNRPSGPNQPVENRFYDELDGALFEAPLRQGVARLSQTLSRRTGAVMQELLRVDLAQEFDFRQENRLADTVVSVRAAYAPFSTGLTFRYDTQRSAPALWAAFASLQIPRFGTTLGFSQLFVPVQFFDRDVFNVFARTLPAAAISASDLGRWGGSGNMRQGIDALVGSPVPAGFREGQRQSAISLEAHVTLAFGLGLTYSGTLYPGATWTLRDPNGNLIPAPGTTEPVPVTGRYPLLGQQNFGISFAPACNCWRLDVIGRLPPPLGQFVQNPPGTGPFVPATFNWRFPDLIFLLTIQNFGTFGAS
jgi:LPS-assembly protein